MTISYIGVFIFAVCCSSSCKSGEWCRFSAFFLVIFYLTLYDSLSVVAAGVAIVAFVGMSHKMCVDFQNIRNLERFIGRHANQFSHRFRCNDLFWLLNNNTRHFCEYNHDKIFATNENRFSIALFSSPHTVNWNGKCDFWAREKAQSDDMCVVYQHCVRFGIILNARQNLKWVRLMPFVLNRLNVQMFKSFWILIGFWMNLEELKISTQNFIFLKNKNGEKEQFSRTTNKATRPASTQTMKMNNVLLQHMEWHCHCRQLCLFICITYKIEKQYIYCFCWFYWYISHSHR